MTQFSEIIKLQQEDVSLRDDCEFCREEHLNIGESGKYGATIIAKIGSNQSNSWYATISPRTGGDPHEDFTIQLMTSSHLTHFSQLASNIELAKNYGIIFSNVCAAMAKIMTRNPKMKSVVDTRHNGIALATYGKCTTWIEKKEHLHIKIFQFRGKLGQPSIVDSTFGKKTIEQDEKGTFVRMDPVCKIEIDRDRFEDLSKRLINLLN